MPSGPILLFDKSSLQSLTVDESVWLDTFYFASITPLFFVETLADLEKEVREGREPEDFVGSLAEKTPNGGGINVHHNSLCGHELLGHKVELRHVPVVAGGRPVRMHDGRRGVVFNESPEAQALNRWQQRKFLEVERDFARSWRDALSGIDLSLIFRQGRDIIKRVGRPRDLPAAKEVASQLLKNPGSRYVAEWLQALEPEGLSRAALERWTYHGSPPLRSYAPYTAHMLTVDLFFSVALGADLIGRERATNKIDIAYLYYLPFCMAFTSRDKLHERTAPLFLEDGQVFIHGDVLKADLAKLDAHYSLFSDEEKSRGVMSFAHYPPVEGEFLASKLWDQLMNPEWRKWASQPPAPKSKEEHAKILAEIKEFAHSPQAERPSDNSEEALGGMLIERSVPVHRGKWRMVSAEVETDPRARRDLCGYHR